MSRVGRLLRNRWIPVLAFAVLSAGATAQVDLSQPLQTAVKILKDRNVIPRQEGEQNPLQPSGFPGLPGKVQQLPPPLEEDFVHIESLQGEVRYEGTKVFVTGGVHIIYKGYDVYATEAEGDLETEIFTLQGNVLIIGRDQVVRGQVVTVDFRNRTFSAEDSQVQLNPTFFPTNVNDPVYVRGATSFGSQAQVHSHDGGITTCNLEHPHFEFEANRTEVRPGRRMILRDMRFKFFGRTLIGLPYLSIPLQERSERYLPEVGEDPDAGYYLKVKYPIALRGNTNFLDARVETYTKLGQALGLDWTYFGPTLNGTMRVYGVVGRDQTFTFTSYHQQKLGALDFTIDNNIQKANYLVAPDNTLWSTRAIINWPQAGGAMSRLTFLRNTNEGPSFSSSQQTVGLNDTRSFGPNTRWNFDAAWAKNSSAFGGGSAVERQQVDLNFRASHDLKKALTELEYRRSIPVGENSNFFSSADRTPVLSLRSDARRLLGGTWAERIPFQTELSVGEFLDPALRERITRSHFDLQMTKPDSGGRRSGVYMDGRFRQTMYSDDTAQYVIGFNGGLRYDFGRDTGFNMRYSYLRAHGFSPLQFDRTGRFDTATMDLSFRPIRSLKVGAQTGYDFLLEQQQETAWQSIGIRADWQPAEWFQLRGLATYDSFQHAWSNFRFDLNWLAGDTFISAGARYDGIRHTWGNVNVFVDGFKWGRLSTSLLASWNGYLKKFEARHLSFTYDLHCAEAILQIIDNQTGFRPGTQVAFFIRLKALPFDTPFGTGRRGQPIGTGTGRDF